MTVRLTTTVEQTRRYTAAFFNDAEAHWARMVANAPDKLQQFRDCMVEGANCVRIAGYGPGRFRAVFTRIAQDNDLISDIGGANALQTGLTAVLETYVDNYAATQKKNTEVNVTPMESKLLPKSTIDAIDFLLIQNDLDRLKKFLEGRPQAEIQRILAYIEWKKYDKTDYK